jgi:hypothetical protein
MGPAILGQPGVPCGAMSTNARSRTPEHVRLEEARAGKKWRRWGTYLSERQWATVREDYSPNGDAWGYLGYEAAQMRAYRWGEDGLLGLSDNRGLIQIAVALWNGNDSCLKERLFGLTGPEGNHGEDVKEEYFYLDATPTHSYCKALYKYPHAAFPYEELRRRAREAGRNAPEPDLAATGVFGDDAYFDVQVEYAKADVEDVLIRLTVTNHGPRAPLDVLPTIWFRNTWSWAGDESSSGGTDGAPVPNPARPSMREVSSQGGPFRTVQVDQTHLGSRWLYAEGPGELLFTENDSNFERLWGGKNPTPYVKDAFHDVVVHGRPGAANPAEVGTKAAARYRLSLAQGETVVLRLRLVDVPNAQPFADHDKVFALRKQEADAFYDAVMPKELEAEARAVYRQAVAGLLWSKQYYHLDVHRWLEGDAASPEPPQERKKGRNREWTHLYNSEVLSVPDKWEYPWYAAWDLAFHTIPLSLVDADFAKEQLSLLLREWYMHPNGQLPAYEWSFGDVNPPVHAWAALRVYQIDRRARGFADRTFLESVFHKLMLNFTWWVNRKDASGNNVFEGGFLGLDNIGVFDRSTPLPGGGSLEQADATSWMGMYCLNLLKMALELAKDNPIYQGVATKFFEHFLAIAYAMNNVAGEGIRLWDDEDGFFYDVLRLPDGTAVPLKVRSIVGLTPLFAVDTIEPTVFERFPAFAKRMDWFLTNRPEFALHIAKTNDTGSGGRRLLSILDKARLVRILKRVLDENEFLSPYGIRALSRVYKDHPYVVQLAGEERRVGYEPAESTSGLFGGNSNWRGPVWFPMNYLIIEALQKYHHYYGDGLRVECPTGSGKWLTLWEVASEISSRMTKVFLRGADGHRPVDGHDARYKCDPNYRELVTFFEYFNGDTGAGLGASHQTGWTALVAKLLQQSPLWQAGADPARRGD